ncbi:hypothetical protein Q1695_001819 [Nippostrongylus brasiliensis]|nr:hypothetical protein Q1695_001819 [Nippostrongylus brasiliensis]
MNRFLLLLTLLAAVGVRSQLYYYYPTSYYTPLYYYYPTATLTQPSPSNAQTVGDVKQQDQPQQQQYLTAQYQQAQYPQQQQYTQQYPQQYSQQTYQTQPQQTYQQSQQQLYPQQTYQQQVASDGTQQQLYYNPGPSSMPLQQSQPYTQYNQVGYGEFPCSIVQETTSRGQDFE